MKTKTNILLAPTYLKENISGLAPTYSALVNIGLTTRFLVIHAVLDTPLKQPYGKKYNDLLYKGDTLEFMIDIGNHRHLEIEVNPNNIGYQAVINRESEPIAVKLEHMPIFTSTVEQNNDKLVYTIKIRITGLVRYGVDIDNFTYNVFRQQFLTDGSLELSALSPTLCPTFHKISKFSNYKKEQ